MVGQKFPKSTTIRKNYRDREMAQYLRTLTILPRFEFTSTHMVAHNATARESDTLL